MTTNFIYINQNTTPNNVNVLSVKSDGSLISVGTFPTQGNSIGEDIPGANTSNICIVNRFLYATNTDDSPATVSSFLIDHKTGLLTFIGKYSTGGKVGLSGALTSTPNNKFLFVLNDESNDITVFNINLDGTLTSIIDSPFSPEGLPIDSGLNDLIVTSDGKYLIASLRNVSKIATFYIEDNGNLTMDHSPISGVASFGMSIANNDEYIFVAGINVIDTFSIETGSLIFKSSIVTTNVQDVIASNDNKFLFASDTTELTAMSYKIENDGSLSLISNLPTGVNTDSYLLELNQAGNLLYVVGYDSTLNGTVSIFSIDSNGFLKLLGSPYTVSTNAPNGIISSNLELLTFRTKQFPCFIHGTKILCFQDNKEVYLPIETLKNGMLVKTLRNDYLPITMIGTNKIVNIGNNVRVPDKLYRCSRDKYPELSEDLIITGDHAILVDNLSNKEMVRLNKLRGKIYVTDRKYRLPVCADDRASIYPIQGVFDIWHIALETNGEDINHGIYANGLLVETAFERILQERMKIIDK